MTITAVFGIDDFTTAFLEITEAGDGCDIEAAAIGASLSINETGDICVIAVLAPTTMDIIEAGDNCSITGQIGTVIVSPSTTDEFTIVAPGEQFLVRVPKHEELVETI